MSPRKQLLLLVKLYLLVRFSQAFRYPTISKTAIDRFIQRSEEVPKEGSRTLWSQLLDTYRSSRRGTCGWNSEIVLPQGKLD